MATGCQTEGSRPSVLSKLPKELAFSFLKEITNNFSDEHKLGKGAFGTVYKGTLKDGGLIAVKKLEENAPGTHDREAFSNKVQNLMALRHDNIVQMVAFCHEAQKKMVEITDGEYINIHVVENSLCYEYLPKGSLHKKLFGESNTIIDWDTRFKIVKGICHGLHFLHTLPKPLIHLDLKPQNILLDDNMTPKIGDFGFCRLFGKEQTRMNTQSGVGSVGYMAPEYLYEGEISARSDIYSLGLMIIEITTREKNCPDVDQNSAKIKAARDFIDEARESWKEERIMSEFPDLNEAGLREVKTCIDLGLECVDLNQNKRPTIKEIVKRLN